MGLLLREEAVDEESFYSLDILLDKDAPEAPSWAAEAKSGWAVEVNGPSHYVQVWKQLEPPTGLSLFSTFSLSCDSISALSIWALLPNCRSVSLKPISKLSLRQAIFHSSVVRHTCPRDSAVLPLWFPSFHVPLCPVPLLLLSTVPHIVWQSSLACTAHHTVSLADCPPAALPAHFLLVSLHPRAHHVDHQTLTLPSLPLSSFPPLSPPPCVLQTLEGKSRPNGSTLLKQRHLEGLGYALVTIPYWEWDQIRGKEERVKYLARKLQQRGNPPPFLPKQRSSLKRELGEPVRLAEKRVKF